MNADVILYRGLFTTLDRSNPTASAVAIKDGLFTAVGDERETMKLRGPSTKVIDLQGRRVLPGLIDNAGPPPAMPDWSPVRNFGGYGNWAGAKNAQGVASRAMHACGCRAPCAVHGHDHARARFGRIPVSDLKSFWGALGCACWAV